MLLLKNHTSVTEFIFVGFMDHPELQIPLFVLFLGIYITTLVGNFGMIILIQIDARLQTPMYFFLSNLSLVDVGYSTVIAPKMLMTFVSENRTIPFIECAVQFYFFCIFVTNECCLLGVMAYDRFVAICNPLLYHTAMSKRLCISLVILSYITGFVNSTAQTIFIFSLSFCGSNVINHFFCDIPPILKLSCSDIHSTDIVHFTLSTIVVMSTILIVLVSYVSIVTTILKINSAEGRRKAFSTCASHIMAVTIFYGTLIFMYLRPTSGYTMDQDKIISVFYTLVIPMLNPLIYSLRNKEVKEAVKRAIGRKIFAC
ncbi:olfactory receptor 1019-like isoform X1 [Podarcis raffonei]|uniref:olfactory receptor 1019-like isoform X1 n=1 Tax=Podarcis raffonei TaxID=65483 RepID=UPI0023292133|nr:olfactory receptor 1019-like isoform X1 [Podarcis raffonei]